MLPSGVPMGDASPAPPAHAATMTPRHANPRSAGRPGVEGLLQQRWRGPARLGVSTFESGLCAAAFFPLVPRRCYNKPRDRPVSCAGMSPHFTSLWGAGAASPARAGLSLSPVCERLSRLCSASARRSASAPVPRELIRIEELRWMVLEPRCGASLESRGSQTCSP